MSVVVRGGRPVIQRLELSTQTPLVVRPVVRDRPVGEAGFYTSGTVHLWIRVLSGQDVRVFFDEVDVDDVPANDVNYLTLSTGDAYPFEGPANLDRRGFLIRLDSPGPTTVEVVTYEKRG